MKNYWTCSKFADWLRGTTKLKYGTSEEWDDWEARAKADYPVRWWLAEEGLDYIQKIVYFIPDQLHAIKYYVNNRWVTHTHSLTAHPRDIKPGEWRDVGNRFLPCLFNELVDFVEVETAWSHIAWGDKEARAKYNPPFYASGWWRWRTWRCPQAGLDHLDWAMTLTNEEWLKEGEKHKAEPTSQALSAKEIKELYTWWTEVYPNRPDPYEASGWSAYCEASRLANDGKLSWMSADKTPELKKQSDKAHKLLQKIEAAYEAEDEVMMIRLIKIRNSLWT
jgi:hypothetical protein